ncbi:MAG: nicotinate-nicotinamide nucleotide adenylyltransferase [Candidatus Sumerlaeia bacterium]|nr:nicotinate-nicotinamide nucleotide adenylyltransferase [Candidatus Sumerlaeia bacterium]
MVRYGFFGGSFDPPHLAHVLGCLWALETGEIDRVLLVPVARHAFGKRIQATFEQRVEMCRLAVARLGNSVEVSTIESELPGVNYTVGTLKALIERHPGASFRLIIGSDVARDLSKWRSSSEVMALAPPLELPRPMPGENFEERPDAFPGMSSTLVRDCLINNDPMVPRLIGRSVRDYITLNRLYTQPDEG